MRRGFNLIEITVVLAVIAVLGGIMLPRAADFVDRIEVRGAVTEIVSLFSTSRHAAIARGAQTTLDIDIGRGALVLHVGADTLQNREIATAHGVEITSNRASITYSPIGVGYGAANFTMTVRRNAVADTIYISRLGRVRH